MENNDLPENCSLNDDHSVTVKLQHPMLLLSELRIRRVKVRDTLAAQRKGGLDADKEIFLFANLCEVTPAQIEELDMRDYKTLQTVYSDFLS